jgi:hypothetical protein
MGRKQLWTRESILQEALKYNTPYEFQKGNKKAYSFAHRFGLLKEATAHMDRITMWNLKLLKEEAFKYKDRGEFYAANKSAYQVAHRDGYLDEICIHMGESYKSVWTLQTITEKALEFNNRSDFQNYAQAAYNRAIKLKILDQVCSHMKPVTSLKERELLKFLKSLKDDFATKRWGKDYELDCYSDSLKLGVEFNGLYWHNDQALKRAKQDPKNYHLNKTQYFESIGIRIIHIWEHEWSERPEQVKDFLRSACGFNSMRIGARKCSFEPIALDQARQFLEKTHIQGAPQQILLALGCIYEKNLIGVCTFGRHHRKKEQIVLNRFACLPDTTVSGFLSKSSQIAYKHFKTPLISWADYSKSQGKGYLNAGWQIEEVLRPDYFYYHLQTKAIRSKQSRKKSIMNTPEGMTEREHAIADGYSRVYDCGKIRMVYAI